MDVDNDPRHWLQEHGPRLLAFARQCVGNPADAEDVFQEAFIHFWRSRATAREPVLYLYRCVRNVAIDWARSRQTRRRHEQAAPVRQPRCAPSETIDQRETDAKVREAIGRLPDNQRRVVALRLWSDMTFDQIGRVLSLPLSTSHALYAAAMRTLERDLKKTVQP